MSFAAERRNPNPPSMNTVATVKCVTKFRVERYLYRMHEEWREETQGYAEPSPISISLLRSSRLMARE